MLDAEAGSTPAGVVPSTEVHTVGVRETRAGVEVDRGKRSVKALENAKTDEVPASGTKPEDGGSPRLKVIPGKGEVPISRANS